MWIQSIREFLQRFLFCLQFASGTAATYKFSFMLRCNGSYIMVITYSRDNKTSAFLTASVKQRSQTSRVRDKHSIFQSSVRLAFDANGLYSMNNTYRASNFKLVVSRDLSKFRSIRFQISLPKTLEIPRLKRVWVLLKQECRISQIFETFSL